MNDGRLHVWKIAHHYEATPHSVLWRCNTLPAASDCREGCQENGERCSFHATPMFQHDGNEHETETLRLREIEWGTESQSCVRTQQSEMRGSRKLSGRSHDFRQKSPAPTL